MAKSCSFSALFFVSVSSRSASALSFADFAASALSAFFLSFSALLLSKMGDHLERQSGNFT
jgi:hypothetical protein